MRQAGTAPATGATVYCLSGLWCAVMYELLVLCRCYQHTSASECASRASIGLCLSDLLCCLWMCSEFRSFGVFGVASCVTEEVRVDLNGSVEWMNAGYQSSMSLLCVITVSTEGSQACRTESVRHLDDLYYVDRTTSTHVTDDAIFRMYCHFCDSNL